MANKVSDVAECLISTIVPTITLLAMWVAWSLIHSSDETLSLLIADIPNIFETSSVLDAVVRVFLTVVVVDVCRLSKVAKPQTSE